MFGKTPVHLRVNPVNVNTPCCCTPQTKAHIFTCSADALIQGNFQGQRSRNWTSLLLMWLSLWPVSIRLSWQEALNTFVPRLQMRCYTFSVLFLQVSPVCLSPPAQHMGFHQLSESNNRKRQTGGTERGIINPLDVPFLFARDQRRNPALNCWGDLKFQSACIKKQL